MSWIEFLNWVGGTGLKVAVGFVLFLFGEYWGGFKKLGSKRKRLVFWGTCQAVPLLATLFMAVSGYSSWGFEEAWWPALQAGFLIAVSGTLFHTTKIKNA